MPLHTRRRRHYGIGSNARTQGDRAMANIRAWFLRFLCLSLLGTTGCALWFQQTHAPVQRTMDVAMSPDVAFVHALRVATAMGCTLWQQDRQTRTLQAYLTTSTPMAMTSTQLTVIVTPLRKGSELLVTHQTLPTYFGLGKDTELSDQFLAQFSHSLEAQQR
jgi:hypothetical protein